MIFALAFLLPFLAVSLVLYVRSGAKARAASGARFDFFDAAVTLLIGLAAGAMGLWFWSTTGQSSDAGWWPILAVLSSVFWASLILLAGALLRVILARLRGR